MMRARLAVLLSLLAGPALAQLQAVDATKRPTCTDGKPWAIWLLNESSATDCDATAGGSSEALCCCKDGTVAACASGGSGGNSFETVNAPSGTDPVADSSTDTLNLTASGGLTITGDSSTDTLAFAVGNVATATALAANPADCTGASNEFAWRIAASGDLSCNSVVAEPIRGSTINAWPSSASSYDDEFTSTTLDAQWTVSTVTGNATSAGSISLLASPSAPVRDLTTVPGWLMWQSDSAGSGVAFVQSWTEDTTSMLFARCQQDQRNFSASQEGSVHIGITVAADSNESVFVWANSTGSALSFRLQVQNNGAFTESASTALHEVQPLSPFVLMLVRNSNSYYGFVSYNEGAAFTYLGTVTKSGVTAFDEIRLVYLGANETPSPIMGCDYIRFEADNVYPTFTR